MPTGTKIAAIVLVVLLGAAGLYYAFVAPPASNTKPASAREGGSSSAGTTANGLSSQTPSTLAPAVPSVGVPPSSASSTPAVGALGSAGSAGSATSPSPTAVSPVPTGLPAGTGASAPREQPGFAPGSLGSAGPGKGDAPAGVRPAPVAAPGATVNGIPLTGTPAQPGATPAVGAVPASGTAPAPAATGGPRPTTGGPTGTVPSSPAVAPAGGAVAPSSGGPLGETTHTVASGETMSGIAKKYLGSENAWRTIAKANPSVDPTAMKIGTKLRIPAADQPDATPGSRTTATAPASSPSGSETTHVVASGDTLASIARKYYGNTKHWERVYSENRTVIGADPAALKIGQKLRIPAKSSVVTGETSRR